jgi:hypothetical protein
VKYGNLSIGKVMNIKLNGKSALKGPLKGLHGVFRTGAVSGMIAAMTDVGIQEPPVSLENRPGLQPGLFCTVKWNASLRFDRSVMECLHGIRSSSSKVRISPGKDYPVSVNFVLMFNGIHPYSVTYR